MVDLVIGFALVGRRDIFQKIGRARRQSAVLRLTPTLLLTLSIIGRVKWIARGEFSAVPALPIFSVPTMV